MKTKIVVGSVAYDPKVVPIWEGIRHYFQSAGVPFDFVLFSNYEAQVEALFDKFIDIAWNTNLAYVKTDRRLSGQSKLLAMRDTDVAFTSKMIVRDNCGIASLKDLKGKKVAFGSLDSAQAAIMPEFYLSRDGLKVDADYTAVRFNSDVGKHGDTGRSEVEVVDALVSGAVDAGAIGESTWGQLTTSGGASGINCIWTSPPYSHCNFTALPELNTETCDLFVQTLLKMDYDNPEHRPILDMEGLKRWVKGGRDGYKAVFEAVDSTGYLKEVPVMR